MLEGLPHTLVLPSPAAPPAQALLAFRLQACPHLQIYFIIIILRLTVGKGSWALFRLRVLHSALQRLRLLSGLLLCRL